jgi:hypothetical protein
LPTLGLNDPANMFTGQAAGAGSLDLGNLPGVKRGHND